MECIHLLLTYFVFRLMGKARFLKNLSSIILNQLLISSIDIQNTAIKSTLLLNGISFYFYILRFNVYSTVKVTIENNEFGKISTKDLELAKYLDFISKVRMDRGKELLPISEALAKSQIYEQINVFETLRNKQEMSTPICKSLLLTFNQMENPQNLLRS